MAELGVRRTLAIPRSRGKSGQREDFSIAERLFDPCLDTLSFLPRRTLSLPFSVFCIWFAHTDMEDESQDWSWYTGSVFRRLSVSSRWQPGPETIDSLVSFIRQL